MIRNWAVISIGLRLLLGGVMCVAGGFKIQDLYAFYDVVKAYSILSPTIAGMFAIFIPWIELIIGFSLIIGLWIRSCLWIYIVLLGSFGVALGVNIYRGVDIACGCFGLDASWGSLELALLQDVVLLAGVLVLFRMPVFPYSVDQFWGGWLRQKFDDVLV